MSSIVPWSAIRILSLSQVMFSWGIFPPLLAIMFSGKDPSKLSLIMSPTLTFGFEANLNTLIFSLLVNRMYSYVPSKLNGWWNFKKRLSLLVSTRFPSINNWLWKVASTDGRLPLQPWEIEIPTITEILNIHFPGLRDMWDAWRNVELIGWDSNSNFLSSDGHQNHTGKTSH